MEYADWLRHQRGLRESTISRHQAFLKRFMTFRFGAMPGNLNDIAPDDIAAFLAQLRIPAYLTAIPGTLDRDSYVI